MKEFHALELVSIEQARQVASIDATEMSTSSDYSNVNSLTYYILCNTWLLLLRNFCKSAWIRVRSTILEKGLVDTIRTFQLEADRVVRDEPYGPWAKVIAAEIHMGTPVTDQNLYQDLIGTDETATLLFLLRYPKRFSPSNNDIIKEKTLRDFVQYENRSKMLQRSETYAYSDVCQYVRKVIKEMYDWDSICDEIDAITPLDYSFSTGANVDAKSTLGAKITAIVTDGSQCDYIRPVFGVYTLDRKAYPKPTKHYSSVIAVPKSYKASRIIAMEPVVPLAYCKAIEEIFRKHDRKTQVINLEDQTINQKLAAVGSYYGSPATLDASHASDLITKSLFVDLFPSQYVRRVLPKLPTYYMVDGILRPLQMASTSGHTLTFRHETIIYKAIVCAAELYCESITGEHIRKYGWAYGDDSLVASEAYDVALYFFSRLGLIINDDKSFATGSYRESCGKDYIDGMDVTSIYYPRFPILGQIKHNSISLDGKCYNDTYRGKIDNSLTMLIDLQKKIFPYSYECARFIASIVQTAYPSVTTSVAGEVCNDLWDYVDSGKPNAPNMYISEKIDLKDRRYWLKPVKVRRLTKVGPAKDSLTGENVHIFDRLCALDTYHTFPVVKYKNLTKKFTPTQIAIYEYWKYISFLRRGPVCNDPLFALLGLTEQEISIDEFYGFSTLALVTKK